MRSACTRSPSCTSGEFRDAADLGLTGVQQELVENPVLEESEPPSEAADGDGDEQTPNPLEEIDFDSYFQDVEGYRPRPAIEIGPELPAFENSLAQRADLSEHLITIVPYFIFWIK